MTGDDTSSIHKEIRSRLHEERHRWGGFRKVLFWVYLVFMLSACVYVPWSMHIHGTTFFKGYTFVWNPPNQISTIEIGRMLSEFGGLTALLCIGLLLTPKNR